MNKFLSGVARAVAESFELPEPILEIGAYQVAGQESYTNLRNYFPEKEYLGVDARPGPGVDFVADVENLPYADASVGTVIAMSTFEHVPHFWKGFEEVHRVLRPDGAFLVCCPFYFHIHNYPSDYWRFTPEAYQLLLEDYPQRVVGWHGPKNRPLGCGRWRFGGSAAPATRSAWLATAPSWMRTRTSRSAGRSGSAMASAGCSAAQPFAYLDQNHWEMEYRLDAAKLRRAPRPGGASGHARLDRLRRREGEPADAAAPQPSAPLAADRAAWHAPRRHTASPDRNGTILRTRSHYTGRTTLNRGITLVNSAHDHRLKDEGEAERVAPAAAHRISRPADRTAWWDSFLDEGPVDVSVCIANWNCRDLLRTCLASLLDRPQGVRLEVIVVDNGSSDGAADDGGAASSPKWCWCATP